MSMGQSNLNEEGQNVRDFTVQIRHANADTIVGTGFVVSTEGHVVTCAHVIRSAGVEPRTRRRILGWWTRLWKHLFRQRSGTLVDGKDAEVGVYFPPPTPGSEAQARRAVVAGCFPQHDDDVVLLQLVGGPVPLAPEQIAVLGRAEPSKGHKFQSYGYRRLGKYEAGLAEGLIRGSVAPPRGRKVQVEPVQLRCDEIDQGMSGAAVLDEERNLVVGVISEVWYPKYPGKDLYTAWAVNARVLSLEPLKLPIRDEPHPRRRMPQPKTDIAAAQAATSPRPGNSLNGAPSAMTEEQWAGRVALLDSISADWIDPTCRVSELIGFGGEGKSSLARRWLDLLLADDSQPQPDGVFWWNFYTNRNMDAFFEAALAYLSGGLIDPRQLSSSNVRAEVIGAMLGARRYLFILDGLEVMQYQEGDQYGLLTSADLRELLRSFAALRHHSFCLITSRVPVIDLLGNSTFVRHKVDRLSSEDGRTLLRKLGVTGRDDTLDQVVANWDGHALTLSLLGGYLVERYRGDVTHIGDLSAPIANEPRYEGVQRLLRSYDTHLSEAERAFLLLFSAFRLPVPESALVVVFRTKSQDASDSLNGHVAALDDQDFDALLKRLRTYQMLTYDATSRHYTTHPLVRAYFAARLDEHERSQVQAVHARIKDYYLASAGEIPEHPTLGELVPLIEAVHHTCYAGAYDQAYNLFWERIYQRTRRVLIYELGAYETYLALLLEFFPDGDTAQEPLVSTPDDKGFIVNSVGFCLMSLGRLAEAVPFYERSIAIDLKRQDWDSASREYHNVAELHAYRGALAASAEAAHEALNLARQAQNKEDECFALARQAWTAHLCGDVQEAGAAFQKAEALEREIDPQKRYLFSMNGIQHAEHLRRVGQVTLARRITEANLRICRRNRWLDQESQCHRVLGDLAADAEEYQEARQHYDQALKIARGSSRDVLIEALVAWGRFATRQGGSEVARSYLDEALSYAVAGGYRIYEADIRVALAWAYRAAGDNVSARAQGGRAQRMSEEMGYYWGQVDAKKVLAAIEGKVS